LLGLKVGFGRESVVGSGRLIMAGGRDGGSGFQRTAPGGSVRGKAGRDGRRGGPPRRRIRGGEFKREKARELGGKALATVGFKTLPFEGLGFPGFALEPLVEHNKVGSIEIVIRARGYGRDNLWGYRRTLDSTECRVGARCTGK
jgi:hypothetical protein